MLNISEFRKNHLRPSLFLGSVILTLIMLTASRWQWTRYHEKLELVETYKTHSDGNLGVEITVDKLKDQDLNDLVNRKIRIKGTFDYINQFLVGNRRSKTGAGFWLMTPLTIEGSEERILISRGFIPYEDKDESTWKKYEGTKDSLEFSGVLSKSVGKRSYFSPGATSTNPKVLLYPNLEEASKILPYPVQTEIYIQGILPPIIDDFPMTDIRIDVPPSTHFWYTFEWILLAILTQVLCFLYQLFRPLNRFK